MLQNIVEKIISIVAKIPILSAHVAEVSLAISQDQTIQEKIHALLTGLDEILADLYGKIL